MSAPTPPTATPSAPPSAPPAAPRSPAPANPLSARAAQAPVPVRWADLQAAVNDGVLAPAQAQALWDRWVRPGTPEAAHFTFSHVLYYFGGLLVIGAMSLFMTLGWETLGPWGSAVITALYLLAALKVATHLLHKGLAIPAGLLATLAVCLVPLLVWSLQVALGLWPEGLGLWPVDGGGSFSAYYTEINWRWLSLELATLAAAVVILRAYRLPFMVLPLALTLWYLSLDITHLLMQKNGFDWAFSRDMSLVFGLATCALGVWVDLRCRLATDPRDRQDFAFWLYVFGALMFWGSLTLHDSASEWGRAGYAAINAVLVFWGAAIQRRVFTVLGALGLAAYLAHVSSRVFHDSLAFTFVLTLLGLGAVALGVWWQRHEAAIHARLMRWLPARLQPLGEARQP